MPQKHRFETPNILLSSLQLQCFRSLSFAWNSKQIFNIQTKVRIAVCFWFFCASFHPIFNNEMVSSLLPVLCGHLQWNHQGYASPKAVKKGKMERKKRKRQLTKSSCSFFGAARFNVPGKCCLVTDDSPVSKRELGRESELIKTLNWRVWRVFNVSRFIHPLPRDQTTRRPDSILTTGCWLSF